MFAFLVREIAVSENAWPTFLGGRYGTTVHQFHHCPRHQYSAAALIENLPGKAVGTDKGYDADQFIGRIVAAGTQALIPYSSEWMIPTSKWVHPAGCTKKANPQVGFYFYMVRNFQRGFLLCRTALVTSAELLIRRYSFRIASIAPRKGAKYNRMSSRIIFPRSNSLECVILSSPSQYQSPLCRGTQAEVLHHLKYSMLKEGQY